VHARTPVVGVAEVVRARLGDGLPVDPVVLVEARVFGREDGRDEGGGDLRQRNGPPVDDVTLPLGAQALLPGADEGGRRRVAPAEENDLRNRDEDESQIEEKEDREIS
jgi:hypothetical protein